jgi:hypothetical protein
VPSEVLKKVGIKHEAAPELAVPEPQESKPAPAETAAEPVDEDTETDKAVDDIVSKESDTVLAAEDELNTPPRTTDKNWKTKLKGLFKQKRTWAIIVLLLLIVFGLPVTRYKLLGLVIKRDVSITVIDSKTSSPVSSAQVLVAGKAARTDANGRAKLKVPIGKKKLSVTKKYFTDYSSSVFVGFKAPPIQKVKLVATGRQVPVTIINTISGKPLANAEIKVLGTNAKTNSEGQAIVVLPTRATKDSATITLSGYNQATVNVTVTDKQDAANTFKLTPSGHVYFLSNLSGTIDVVKTNLDGSGRQTVVTGTGKEDSSTTLLATRDWRYVVLAAKRDTRQALYLIDTSNDKMTQFDSSNASYTLVGWSGHNFIYDLVSNTVPESQSGHELLKSYDADNAQLNQLDQNQAEGSGDNYGYQGFGNFYILDTTVAYTVRWYTSGNFDLNSKTNSIRAAQPGHQNKKDYQTFAAAGNGYIQSALYKPTAVHFEISNYRDNSVVYYNFENQAVTTVTLDQADITKSYPTYLVSPAGTQTFWTELRDGKNALLIGDASGGKSKQIGSFSEYTPYGWYSDNYVLVSKNGSELYIMPAGGLAAGYQPTKVSDYYKLSQSIQGYGYGYGGL